MTPCSVFTPHFKVSYHLARESVWEKSSDFVSNPWGSPGAGPNGVPLFGKRWDTASSREGAGEDVLSNHCTCFREARGTEFVGVSNFTWRKLRSTRDGGSDANRRVIDLRGEHVVPVPRTICPGLPHTSWPSTSVQRLICVRKFPRH